KRKVATHEECLRHSELLVRKELPCDRLPAIELMMRGQNCGRFVPTTRPERVLFVVGVKWLCGVSSKRPRSAQPGAEGLGCRRLDRGGACGSAGPYGGGRPGSGLSERPARGGGGGPPGGRGGSPVAFPGPRGGARALASIPSRLF